MKIPLILEIVPFETAIDEPQGLAPIGFKDLGSLVGLKRN